MNVRIVVLGLCVYLAVPVVMLLRSMTASDSTVELLNVSYDPTRELYRKINRAFAEECLRTTGQAVRIRQSHGGSGSQARAVIDGLPADVLTLAMWSDIDAVRKKKLVADDWEKQFPDRSLPYTSTIVFVVRKGNPFRVRDWPDLMQTGLKIITANPKTGGGAKLSLLAAWGSVIRTGGTKREAEAFITQMYRQTPVLDSGARGSTITFARRMIGDVHLTWENEALLEAKELPDELEVIYPKSSIRAEPHVALVTAVTDKKGTRTVAEAYLRFLYSEAGQEIVADNYFRPSHPEVAKKYADRFGKIDDLFTIRDLFPGGWDEAQKVFFADGAMFDRIYQK